MTLKDKLLAQKIYLFLAALFITSLVVSNLIFQKFFYWYPFEVEVFGAKLFEISVGLLPYPLTFLITDLISEIYGKKRANQVVVAGIFASVFSLLIILVSDNVPAIAESPVSDETFQLVFGNSAIAVFASMSAYLFAQFIDIQIYHFWKRLTKGRHLWLRNNFSTWFSQFVDTFSIVFLLCSFGILPWSSFKGLLISGFLFKVIVAALDTPFLYLGVYLFRKRFNLKINEEIDML
ncbi:queuosine precursor transporter [Psychroserpens sp.]|uniref:queuosine precursor transporter n=1 Tax=Psychroserpens sp. TaxID=2020870 RepID=UPI001B1FD083|nr:queuosine precursor transporter [Psychroserpens sp.]MBO6607887.1 queuosine precursor transporter [Psychroserpens sp.]MBO6631239.1 queuosine precursor transporter [Psychroserpens sp.]MBO6654986.1 queuosine precursor transporter [Psychroserpens sp.]MBO6682940.1 queuosine precursor transporter [Psychroserpens sp.]MBO6751245.1 queuosine precursor transporter [Psychroserpens sp.]